ncbi:Amidohydrolase [uncultured delta proteobacterium]|uniref:Amidohydrolase n=1 Tax=uncultured delta proteobacterium TaxID=34034 RepID=A0A212JIE9_9DELT|nr:Amidohydrolase [uncultured delta proteobacterium]
MTYLSRAMELDGAVTAHRRWLHTHAELPFEEKETTAYIIKALEGMGIEVISFPDYYGAIGVIHGNKPGKTLMLRADIDALPMEEHSGESFAATNGCMHACGHDAHTAMLLGAAQMLAERKDELAGTVKLLFQSAEEGFTGARYYADKGYLDGVAAIFGMHVWGTLEAPLLNIQDGPRMASCDNFTITIRGHGAHGSTPHLAKDPIVAASSIIMNLQTFASRNYDPLYPLVVTVGTVKSGSQFNIIPEIAVMEGTIRTLSRELKPTIVPGIRRIIENTAQALGCTAEMTVEEIDTPIVNADIHMNDIAREAAVKLFGKDVLVPMAESMGADDFSYLQERVPGLYVFLGCLNESKGIVHPNHSDKFRIDEDILHRGAALYAQFAHDFLADGASNGGKA